MKLEGEWKQGTSDHFLSILIDMPVQNDVIKQ